MVTNGVLGQKPQLWLAPVGYAQAPSSNETRNPENSRHPYEQPGRTKGSRGLKSILGYSQSRGLADHGFTSGSARVSEEVLIA